MSDLKVCKKKTILRETQQNLRPSAGFTFFEVVIVVAILIIFTFIAIPSFQNFISSQRLQEVAFQMVQDLRLVREDAILYQQDLRVYFCTDPKENRNFYMFELFQKDPMKETHYIPSDTPDGIHFVKRELKYNFTFTSHKPFLPLGWISGKEYYYLTFYCGKDNHFRGQPSAFDTIEITDPNQRKTWYVIVNSVGRVRMSGSPP